MRTLSRYIALLFARNFALCLLALVGIYVVNAILGDILDGRYPIWKILVFHGLKSVETLLEMVPPSALIATVITLSGLSRTNELTACYSLGAGLRHVMGVILSVVFIICCISLVIQDRVLPPVYRKRTIFYWKEMKGRSDFYIDVKQDKIWYRSNDLILNLRTFDPIKKTIHGMSVYAFDQNFDVVEVLAAKQAVFDGSEWKLKDGLVTVFSDQEAFPMTKPFKERRLTISETPKDFQEIEKEVDGLRLKELYRYIDKTQRAGIDTKSFEVKFHYRISLSFTPLIMSFLAVPFSTRRRREGGIGRDLGIGLAFTFFYWLFYSMGLSLGKSGGLPPVLAAWLPSVIFGGLAAFLLTRRKEG